MLRRQHHERGPEDSVGASGVDPDRCPLVCRSVGPPVRRSADREDQLRPLRPSQPVPLRRRRALRPVHLGLVVEIGQQPVGVLGDPEEPLLQRPLLHHRAAPLAAAVDDLLVGEHGLVLGAPVDRGRLLVGLPRLQELEEDPLGPLVVARVGGRELVPPVEHPADPAELAAEVLDVLRDQDRGVDPLLDRVVLAVDPERVVADRLEDVVPLEPLEPAVDVRPGEGEHVPHVEPFGRRVGEHHQVEERPRGPVEIGLVGAALGPAGLPLGLDGVGVVGRVRRGGRHGQGLGRFGHGGLKLARPRGCCHRGRASGGGGTMAVEWGLRPRTTGPPPRP